MADGSVDEWSPRGRLAGGCQTSLFDGRGAALPRAVLKAEPDGVLPLGVVLDGGQSGLRIGSELSAELVSQGLCEERVTRWLTQTAEAVTRALVHQDGRDVPTEGDGIGPCELRLPAPIGPLGCTDVGLATEDLVRERATALPLDR